MMQVSTFADMEGEESFDSSLLGYADEVVEERIADDDVILIKGTKTTSAVSNLFYFEFGFSFVFGTQLLVILLEFLWALQ